MHKHLLVSGKLSRIFRDPRELEKVLDELVSVVNMKIFMPAKAEYCYDAGNEGVTGIVVITTSHASIHIWETGEFHFDLYSCKDFQVSDVLTFLEKYFEFKNYEYMVIDRETMVAR